MNLLFGMNTIECWPFFLKKSTCIIEWRLKIMKTYKYLYNMYVCFRGSIANSTKTQFGFAHSSKCYFENKISDCRKGRLNSVNRWDSSTSLVLLRTSQLDLDHLFITALILFSQFLSIKGGIHRIPCFCLVQRQLDLTTYLLQSCYYFLNFCQ